MSSVLSDSDFIPRAIGLIFISTGVLTASFIGIIAIFSASAPGITNRVSFYLIALGVVFVATILYLEQHSAEGQVILVTAIALSLAVFVATTLTVEGILFSFRHPDRVFVSQTVYYLITAALIGTGIGYWGLQHWREFTRIDSDSL